MKKKDLYKPGRVIEEYINFEKGEIIRSCLSCIHRDKISECSSFICSGGQTRYLECNPPKAYGKYDPPPYLFWESRFEIPDFIKEKDFLLD